MNFWRHAWILAMFTLKLPCLLSHCLCLLLSALGVDIQGSLRFSLMTFLGNLKQLLSKWWVAPYSAICRGAGPHWQLQFFTEVSLILSLLVIFSLSIKELKSLTFLSKWIEEKKGIGSSMSITTGQCYVRRFFLHHDIIWEATILGFLIDVESVILRVDWVTEPESEFIDIPFCLTPLQKKEDLALKTAHALELKR